MAARSRPDDSLTGLFVAPLHQGRGTAKRTAKRLFRLMHSLGVLAEDIGEVVVDPNEGFALIQLHSKDAEEFLIKACRDVRDVMNFFDLRLLTAKPKHFKVVRRGSPRFSPRLEFRQPEEAGEEAVLELKHIDPCQAKVETLPGPSNRTIESPPIHACDNGPLQNAEPSRKTEICRRADSYVTANDSTTGPRTSTDSSSLVSQQEFERLDEEEEDAPILLHASTSVSATRVAETLVSRRSSPVLKVDVKTSTPHVSPCFCPETIFYRKKQHVCSYENRHVEFKRGGNVSDLRTFRGVIGKYLCAFLNTEGGTIFFGVTDDGKVVGIEASRPTEDTIRLSIDNAVGSIRPSVETSSYSVNFAKVMDDDGTIDENLKVLEVCVKPRDPPRHKFKFNDVTYVRRDGSLRTL